MSKVVTFLATPKANIGAIRAILPNLRNVIEPIRQMIIDAERGTRTRIE